MKKNILSKIVLIIIILISIFAGYENPSLVEIPKKNIKYFLKQIGLIDSFVIKKEEKSQVSKKYESEDFFANSFILEIKKIREINKKTSGLYVDENEDILIFTQDGAFTKNDEIKEINLPRNFTTDNEGGVRSVIYYNKKYYALISRKDKNCNYSSLIEIKTQNLIFDTKCIPDEEKVNFAGLGGAFTFLNESLLLSVGTPTHFSDTIDDLAQNKDFFYGKILQIEKNDSNNDYNINIFTLGHRNPQGLTKIDEKLFSTEHGPRGGDELNIIQKGKNYGWPIVSFGTRYSGKSYRKKYDKDFKNPLFSFNPAIAPSMLSNCPSNLSNYYSDYICLMGLTLKEMSLVVYLIDKKNEKLISYEKINLEKRLRHLALDKEINLYVNKDNIFYFSSDKDGVYQAKFKDFR